MYGKRLRIANVNRPRHTMWVSSSDKPLSRIRLKTDVRGPSLDVTSSMYSLLHPAHSRSIIRESRLGSDVRGEALDELVDGNIAFSSLAPPRADADRAVVDVVIADDQHVGQLLQLRFADAVVEPLRRLDH